LVKQFSNVCILFSFQAALFAALRRCALVDPAAPRTALGYSRCGRTDRGVSARGQVVALNLRTRGPAPDFSPGAPCDDAHEIDYVKVLNGALPADVWATGWAPVPPAFSARFSAAAREYRYFIVEDGGLDFGAMRAAAAGLVGTRDFRNVCKPDIPAVVNYVRTLHRVDVDPWPGCAAFGGLGGEGEGELGARADPAFRGFTGAVVTVAGTAFLWHQVRCIVSLLLMAGRGQEAPESVVALADVSATPRKPQYGLAPPQPLILASATFPGLVWRRTEGGLDAARAGVRALLADVLSRAALLGDAAAALDAAAGGRPPPTAPARAVRHRPLADRPADPPLEDRLRAKGRALACGPPRRPVAAAAGPVEP
jgi:tRNA pseudouridine38/39 synthase